MNPGCGRSPRHDLRAANRRPTRSIAKEEPVAARVANSRQIPPPLRPLRHLERMPSRHPPKHSRCCWPPASQSPTRPQGDLADLPSWTDLPPSRGRSNRSQSRGADSTDSYRNWPLPFAVAAARFRSSGSRSDPRAPAARLLDAEQTRSLLRPAIRRRAPPTRLIHRFVARRPEFGSVIAGIIPSEKIGAVASPMPPQVRTPSRCSRTLGGETPLTASICRHTDRFCPGIACRLRSNQNGGTGNPPSRTGDPLASPPQVGCGT